MMIGIAGGTGSGKTTVAKTIVERLGQQHVALISQDAYYIDPANLQLEQRKLLNFDHPDAIDFEMLLTHLHLLKQGNSIEMPIYDFSTYQRLPETFHLESKPVVVIEGIHVLSEPSLRTLLDIKVFVDTDPDVRVLRRVLRDTTERGRTIESVYHQYLSTVKPMHDAFVEPSKRFADLIIPEGGENEIAITLLTTRINQFLFEYQFNV